MRKAAEKRMMDKASTYDLINIIKDIDEFYRKNAQNQIDYDSSNNDLGILYCVTTISTPNELILSSLREGGPIGHEKNLKKKFQDFSRYKLYSHLEDLRVLGENPTQLRNLYLLEIEKVTEKVEGREVKLRRDSIEYFIDKLTFEDWVSDNLNFAKVGKAVRSGSQAYSDEKQRQGLGEFDRYKVFLEYHRIQDTLKKII